MLLRKWWIVFWSARTTETPGDGFWLDSARYADTTGSDSKTDDYRYVNAWSYRDYVINAFNADKPYDQFLKEQIAADLLPGAEQKPK